VDPRNVFSRPVSEGPAEEGLTPSPVVSPAGLSSTCTRWALFTNVMEGEYSEVRRGPSNSKHADLIWSAGCIADLPVLTALIRVASRKGTVEGT
jgi:hypothetical protein